MAYGDHLSTRDFNLASANDRPVGIDIDDTYAYVVDAGDSKVYVYQLSDGARQSTREFNLDSANDKPTGIFTDNTYAYVADLTDNKVYVYQLSDGARQSARDFNLDSSNNDAHGISTDGTYAYVVDFTDNKVYVYQLSDGARQNAREFILGDTGDSTHGISTDNTYAYAVDFTDSMVYVYRLSDGGRQTTREFSLDSANDRPTGISADSTHAYVVDLSDNKIYVYDAAAPNASVAVSINVPAAGDERTTVKLSANVTGDYDAVTYAWVVAEGTLDDATLEEPTWTRPSVAADKNVDIDLAVEATGSGTNAKSGTTATANATTVSASVTDTVAVATNHAVLTLTGAQWATVSNIISWVGTSAVVPASLMAGDAEGLVNSISINSPGRDASMTISFALGSGGDWSSTMEGAGRLQFAYGDITALFRINAHATGDTSNPYSWIVLRGAGDPHAKLRWLFENIEADITDGTAQDVTLTMWNGQGTSPFPADPPAPTYDATQAFTTPARTGSNVIGGWARNSVRFASYTNTPRTPFPAAFRPDTTEKYLEQLVMRRDRSGIIVFIGISESGGRTNTPEAPLSDAFLDHGEIELNVSGDTVVLPLSGDDVFDPRNVDEAPDRTEFYRLDYRGLTAVRYDRWVGGLSVSQPEALTMTFRIRQSTEVDTTAPITTGRFITNTAGDRIQFFYNESLNLHSIPAGGDFTLTSGGSANAVTNVVLSGMTVTLTPTRSIAHNEVVTLSYTKGTNPIQDTAGNDAADFSGATVENFVPDTTGPTVTTAETNTAGTTITLTYNEALDTNSVPANGDYALTSGGTANAITNVAVSGMAVTLTLTRAIISGQTVTLNYTPGTNPIQDALGNDAAALTSRAIHNNVAAPEHPHLGALSIAAIRKGTTPVTKIYKGATLLRQF